MKRKVSRSLQILAVGLVLAGLWGCSGLIPVDMVYLIDMEPVLPEGRGDYYIDQDDSSIVFSKEGALLKIKPLSSDELNRRHPRLFDGRHINPYTYEKKDLEKWYIPPRFTVFEVTVVNKTYAKIQFDPARAKLFTDKGEEFRYYDPGRAGEGVDPLGGNRFSEYYQTELGRSGIDKELNLERMGVIYKSAFHRFRTVFREDERRGLIVFDPLEEDVGRIRLEVEGFALSFDSNGRPELTVDAEFDFIVEQGAVRVDSLMAQKTAK
jgi:hypothetical protein